MSPKTSLLGALLLAVACGGGGAGSIGPAHLDIPVPPLGSASADAKGAAKEQPPTGTATKASPFPAIGRRTLDNGLALATVEAHALPVVQVRVLIRTGMGYGTAGAAELTASMLKDGGTKSMTSARFLERLESIGASLNVDVDFDRTVFGVGVTKGHLDDALALLAEMIQAPRFDGTELRKLKARRTDDATEAARASGQFTAMRTLFRELYPEGNPYATYDLLPSEIAKVTDATVRDFHKKFYVPKNAEIIVAGDVDLTAAAQAVSARFGAWKGTGTGEAPKVSFPDAIAPAKRRVVIASRPKSVQSDVFVVTLAPPRNSPDWADLRVANQVLGGGVASRLFMDVREQRSLAYSTGSRILELKNGKQPLLTYAGTESKKTALAVQGIFENYDRIATQPIDDAEVQNAGRYLADVFAIRLETVGTVADYVAIQDSLGLPDGYWDQYRAAVRSMPTARASAAAAKLFPSSAALIVVAGDVDVIGGPLSHFGDVVVVDPEKEFKTIRTIPKNELAPLE